VSVLVVAALAVTTTIARSELVLRKADAATDGTEDAIRSVLQLDLEHAHHWRPVEGGFAVQTNLRLAGPGLTVEHVPSVVTYCVMEVDGRRHLLRVQTAGSGSPERELVAAGVERIALAPAKDVRPNRYGWKGGRGECVVHLAWRSEGEEPPREVPLHLRMGGAD